MFVSLSLSEASAHALQPSGLNCAASYRYLYDIILVIL